MCRGGARPRVQHPTVQELGSGGAPLLLTLQALLLRPPFNFPRPAAVLIPHQPPLPAPSQCPNLKAIQSMGAGVDSMIGEPSLPRHVPLLRVIDPLMSERMATWVLWGVINCQVSTNLLGCASLNMRHSCVHCVDAASCMGNRGIGGVRLQAQSAHARAQRSATARRRTDPNWHVCCRQRKPDPYAWQLRALQSTTNPPVFSWPQRKCDAYMVAQRAARWDKGVENFRNVDNRELRVGVMGLGASVW